MSVTPVEEPVPRSDSKSSSWLLPFLASAAGLTAYLALLGGVLLALRFDHAGLPVVQAVSAVPLPTLVTTALIELLAPLLRLAIFISLPLVILIVIATVQRIGPSQKNRMRTAYLAACQVLIIILSFLITTLSLTGLASFTAICIIVLANRWQPLLAGRLNGSNARLATVAIVFVAASLPVLARQVVEPLNMEVVTIERSGQHPVQADLIAVRDSSIVVARCHHLMIVPMPASVTIDEGLPRESTGRPVVTLIGLPTPKAPPRRMPC